jgi:hypothetical protein
MPDFRRERCTVTGDLTSGFFDDVGLLHRVNGKPQVLEFQQRGLKVIVAGQMPLQARF